MESETSLAKKYNKIEAIKPISGRKLSVTRFDGTCEIYVPVSEFERVSTDYSRLLLSLEISPDRREVIKREIERLKIFAAQKQAEAWNFDKIIEDLKVAIRPFAEASAAFDKANTDMRMPLTDDDLKPDTKFTHRHLRRARKALENAS